MSYSSIDARIWEDPIFSDLELKEKLLLFYLYTSPAINMSGIYGLAFKIAALHTGLLVSELPSLMNNLQEKGLIKWDETSKVVWVKGYLLEQVSHHKKSIGSYSDEEETDGSEDLTGLNKKKGLDNRIKRLARIYHENPRMPFWEEFFVHNIWQLGDYMHIFKPVRKMGSPNLSGQTLKGQASPFQAPLKP
jgi:hypothetical protein